MGEVYEAEHVSIPRRFAVKVLTDDYSGHQEALHRFHREASTAASLGSPYIVDVYDFNQTESGNYFMAMELLEGENLRQRLKRIGRLEPDVWLGILEQIAEGLHVAHEAGIVHRDLKPDNLFLTQDRQKGEVLKILDFGICKIRRPAAFQTRTESYLGTPSYMSPEQARGSAKDVDIRSDIFSLGTISYEALAGRLPFQADSVPGVLLRICDEEPTPLAELAPWIPSKAAEVVHKALRKKPDDRFADVPSFVDALRQGLMVGPDVRFKSGAGSTSDAVHSPPPPPPPEFEHAAGAGPASEPPFAAGSVGNVPHAQTHSSTSMSGAAAQQLPVDRHGVPDQRDGKSKRLWIILGSVAGVAALGTLVAVVARNSPKTETTSSVESKGKKTAADTSAGETRSNGGPVKDWSSAKTSGQPLKAARKRSGRRPRIKPFPKVMASISNADDKVRLYVNGKLAVSATWGRGGGGRPVGHRPGYSGWVDITRYCKRGRNTLRFWVWNAAIPGSVSGTFRVKVDGKIRLTRRFKRQDSSSGVKYNRTAILDVP